MVIVNALASGQMVKTDTHWQGTWINEDYHKSLLNHKTPFESYPDCPSYSALIFQEEAGTVLLVLNFWEGFTCTTKSISANKLQGLKQYPTELCSTLSVEIKGRRLVLTDAEDRKTRFVSYPEKYPGGGKTPAGLVNELFFAGQYQDEMGQSPIAFNVDGSLSGMGAYHSYRIQVAFIMKPLIDIVTFFDDEHPDGVHYAWELAENALVLTRLVDDPATRYKKGPTRIVLTRVR